MLSEIDFEATYKVHREFSTFKAGEILSGARVGAMRNGPALVAQRYLLRTPRPEPKKRQRKAEAGDGLA
jgi:hypothetical protein